MTNCNRCPENKQQKHVRKCRGVNPPNALLGTNPPSDNRHPPTWGSNLMMVKDVSKKLTRPGTEQENCESDDESLGGLIECLSFIEEFVDEFKTGKLNKNLKKPKNPQGNILEPSKELGVSSHDSESKELDSVYSIEEEGEEEDGEINPNDSSRVSGIRDDSLVIDHIKEQVKQSCTKRDTVKLNRDGKTASPAQAGIPLTTPRPSPSPKRPGGIEWLHESVDENPLPNTEDVLPEVFEVESLDVAEYKNDKIDKSASLQTELLEWNTRFNALTLNIANLELLTKHEDTDEDV